MKIKKSAVLSAALLIMLSSSPAVKARARENNSSAASANYINNIKPENISEAYIVKDGKVKKLSKEDIVKSLKTESKTIKGKNITTGLFNYYNMNLSYKYSAPKRYTPWYRNETSEFQSAETGKNSKVNLKNTSLIDLKTVNKSFNTDLKNNMEYNIFPLKVNIKPKTEVAVYISDLNCNIKGKIMCESVGTGTFEKENIKVSYFSEKNEYIVYIVEKNV